MSAFTISYASTYVLAIVWKLNLFVYILMVFILSFLFGAVILNLSRVLIYATISIVLGMLLAIWLISTPPMFAGESAASVEFSTLSALVLVAKLFLVNIVFVIMGTTIGCFLSETLSEFEA